jgi:hypothetical protein
MLLRPLSELAKIYAMTLRLRLTLLRPLLVLEITQHKTITPLPMDRTMQEEEVEAMADMTEEAAVDEVVEEAVMAAAGTVVVVMVRGRGRGRGGGDVTVSDRYYTSDEFYNQLSGEQRDEVLRLRESRDNRRNIAPVVADTVSTSPIPTTNSNNLALQCTNQRVLPP